MTKFEVVISQFEKALKSLKEVLLLPKNNIVRDSAIKRFEYTVDISWKLIKFFIEEKKGIICNSPKDCFRQAYEQGIIDYDDRYLKYIDMRNQTSHTYNEKIAEEIYNNLNDVCKDFEILFEKIKNYQ